MNVDETELLPRSFCFFSHHKQFYSLWHFFCAIVTACLIMFLVTKLTHL